VHDCRTLQGHRTRHGLHLEAARIVDAEDREEPVVGVLANPPGELSCVALRVRENPEEDRRIRRDRFFEVRRFQTQRAGYRPHQQASEFGRFFHVFDDSGSQCGRSARVLVRAVQRKRFRGGIGLRSEVNTGLPILLARRKLIAKWKVPSPRGSCFGHRDFVLLLLRQVEELSRQTLQFAQRLRVDGVRHAEEPDLPARGINRAHGFQELGAPLLPREQCRDVNHRDRGHRTFFFFPG
jgi:hypothetical protein